MIIIGMFFLFYQLLKKNARRRRRPGFGEWSRTIDDIVEGGQRELPTLEDEQRLAQRQVPTPPQMCPVCGHPVDTRAVTCPRCAAVHHPECWKLNDGCGRCQRLDPPAES